VAFALLGRLRGRSPQRDVGRAEPVDEGLGAVQRYQTGRLELC
jgi:hypothetical protein